MNNENLFVSQGWLCPRCKRVNSPSMVQCMCSEKAESATTHNTKIEVTPKEPSLAQALVCKHLWDTSRVLTSNPPQYKCKKCGAFSGINGMPIVVSNEISESTWGICGLGKDGKVHSVFFNGNGND